eukprot:4268457-Lingulodinium_polyedra.AAC.1
MARIACSRAAAARPDTVASAEGPQRPASSRLTGTASEWYRASLSRSPRIAASPGVRAAAGSRRASLMVMSRYVASGAWSHQMATSRRASW